MKSSAFALNRRGALVRIVGWGAIGLKWLLAPGRTVLAMGSLEYPQGIQEMQGEVAVNGLAAGIGTLVQPGDTITTGPTGFAIFVVGKSVYQIRGNTTLELTGKTGGTTQADIAAALRMLNGKMLAVFSRSRSRKIITTATAVVGIRGSGIYIEAEADQSYICTCYGIADITAKADTRVQETVRTAHHEAPRFVYAAGAETLIAKAPVFNHTDAELIKLEKFVSRRPPFVEEDRGGGGGY